MTAGETSGYTGAGTRTEPGKETQGEVSFGPLSPGAPHPPTVSPQEPRHLSLHHHRPAFPHLPHVAEGPHETLILQLPQ